ncbi:MAG: endonuclease MutS2 [Lentisphaeria bacterium]|nr:endonuclease MutS2 [Lentisphaeria bacterium]
MDQHAFHVLEFDALLETLAGYAQTGGGRRAVLALRPAPGREASRGRQGLYRELMGLAEAGVSFPGLQFEDIGEALRRAAPDGAVLDSEELLLCRQLLDAAAEAAAFLQRDGCRNCPELQALGRRIDPCTPLARRLHRCLDQDGTVPDSASPALAELRRRAVRLEQNLQRTLERLLQDPKFGGVVQDAYVTQRNGRYVIPIRREEKAAVPGIIHDHSNSGHTVFVEPTLSLPMGNELAGLRLEERDEIRRILAGLSAAVREASPLLAASQQALTELDAAAAVARWGAAYRCTFPADGRSIRLVQARHPLLEQNLRAEGRAAELVPLDLSIAGGVRTVVITGSNTGGKTVALKTLGLCLLLAQAGLPAPVDGRTELPWFDQIYADIGDEQSLATNLSTFSAHMTHITAILQRTRHGRSLVLLDELGAGTDPLEGGALACAILQELASRPALTLATTHLGIVKQFVHEHRQMLNAAVRFNTETLRPEYVVDIGRPGASHALLIAERLRLPREVIRAAEKMLSTDHLRLEQVLSRMEDDQRKIAVAERDMQEARDALVKDREAVRQERDHLRSERRRLMQDAYRQAAGIVENARQEMENQLRHLRQTAPDNAAAAREQAAQARKTINAREKRLDASLRQTADRPPQPIAPEQLAVGMRVWVERLRGHGTVRALASHRRTATVAIDGLPFTVATSELGRARDNGNDPTVEVKVSRPRVSGATPVEINLIGLRVEEALQSLDHYLNRSAMANLGEVRIIHGFGTGRLRQGIHEWLRGHALVRSFRLGGEKDPGGAGATHVTLA